MKPTCVNPLLVISTQDHRNNSIISKASNKEASQDDMEVEASFFLTKLLKEIFSQLSCERTDFIVMEYNSLFID